MIVNHNIIEDRRVFERFDARFPARLMDSSEDFGEKIYLSNASARGVKLQSKERFSVNEHIDLEVSLPDGQDPMIIRGEVVWFQGKGDNEWEVGIKFDKIDLMRVMRLYKFVEGLPEDDT